MPSEDSDARSPTTSLLNQLVDALLAERDDPRNQAEHPGFHAGMTRAITVGSVPSR
jgi:hypothetical protein